MLRIERGVGVPKRSGYTSELYECLHQWIPEGTTFHFVVVAIINDTRPTRMDGRKNACIVGGFWPLKNGIKAQMYNRRMHFYVVEWYWQVVCNGRGVCVSGFVLLANNRRSALCFLTPLWLVPFQQVSRTYLLSLFVVEGYMKWWVRVAMKMTARIEWKFLSSLIQML